MACRVGITTDRAKREAYWRGQHPSLCNWKIENEYETKTEAQAEENRIAKERGCKSAPGGGPEIATWYVYSFEYDELKDIVGNWLNSDDK